MYSGVDINTAIVAGRARAMDIVKVPLYIVKLRGCAGFSYAQAKPVIANEQTPQAWVIATVYPDGRVEVDQAALDAANACSRKKAVVTVTFSEVQP